MKSRIQLGFGKRILKTGVAVFITAWLCELLDWPAIFAVIAAIVTIEPSIHSSIRKGLVRFPAAAIGAAFAMFLDYLFGPSAIAFTLSAVLTIYVCQLVRWHDGMIVAALTAVNMITLTEAHFLENFFIRLGTTSLGIAVSILINLFIFPPRFGKEIESSYARMLHETKELLAGSVSFQLYFSNRGKKQLEDRLERLRIELQKTLGIISYQIDDFRFGRFNFTYKKKLLRLRKNILAMQKMTFHIGNLLEFITDDKIIEPDNRQILRNAWEAIDRRLIGFEEAVENRSAPHSQITPLFSLIRQHCLDERSFPLWNGTCIIAMEMLAIYQIAERFSSRADCESDMLNPASSRHQTYNA